MPADAVHGSTVSEDTEAEVVLQDGTWVWCQVIGQRKDRQGRWCVGIRWYASPSIGGREGWFLLDHRYSRRPDGLILQRRMVAHHGRGHPVQSEQRGHHPLPYRGTAIPSPWPTATT
jgi:hypothetical protein